MLIRMSWWEKVRDQFSADEKGELYQVVTAKTICPPGRTIDETRLRPELRQKLEELRDAGNTRRAGRSAHA